MKSIGNAKKNLNKENKNNIKASTNKHTVKNNIETDSKPNPNKSLKKSNTSTKSNTDSSKANIQKNKPSIKSNKPSLKTINKHKKSKTKSEVKEYDSDTDIDTTLDENEDTLTIKSETKLQKALKKENEDLLSIIGDREDVLSIKSDDLAKLMGDTQSRKALIKKYGKNRLKFEMYVDKLTYLISKGGKIRKIGDVNKDSFQIATDRIYTYNNIIKIFAIEETPDLINIDFEHELRTNFINRFPTCELVLREYNLPYYIDFESKDIIFHLEYWAKRGHRLSVDEEETKNDFVRTLIETKSKSLRVNREKRMLSSFFKVKEYQKKGFRFNRTYKFAYIYAPDEFKLDDCAAFIKESYTDYKVTLIKGILPQFLKTFGTAYLEDDKTMLHSLNTQVLADIDSAKITPYEQGSSGAKGICVGLDVETNLPVNLPLSSDAKGKTVLIVGPTGEGKSAEAKGIAYFHKINKDRIVFMDYEGYEYNAFIKKYGGIKISQDLVNPVCVNSMKLGDCRYTTEDEAKRRLNKAKSSTSMIFKLLYADSIGEMDSSDLNKIIDDVIQQTYMRFNVVEGDRQTYHNSLKITYFDIYDTLQIQSKSSKESQSYLELMDNAINRLASYWSRTGSKRFLFEREVSFEDIYNANIIQFSLGMAEQRENTVEAKDVRLKYFNLEYILTEYALYNRSKDIFTAVFLEELQRAEGDEILMRLYNHLITGGRKLNLNNYILTNSLKNLFTSPSKDAKAIAENINILLIGPIKKEARDALIEAYDLEQLRSQIENVASLPEYDYSFLMTYQLRKVRHSSIVRMDLPDEIMKNEIFHTRTIRS